jgi:phosphatidylinositol phospholipase C epsilon
VSPIDYVRYVGADLASISIIENPSVVKNLVKRLSEVSSWITHILISQPTHDDRRNCLSAILRVVDTCLNIGNFNTAVEILTGLNSTKLRPFWLSLKHEERQRFEELVDILLSEGQPHQLYIEV